MAKNIDELLLILCSHTSIANILLMNPMGLLKSILLCWPAAEYMKGGRSCRQGLIMNTLGHTGHQSPIVNSIIFQSKYFI